MTLLCNGILCFYSKKLYNLIYTPKVISIPCGNVTRKTWERKCRPYFATCLAHNIFQLPQVFYFHLFTDGRMIALLHHFASMRTLYTTGIQRLLGCDTVQPGGSVLILPQHSSIKSSSSSKHQYTSIRLHDTTMKEKEVFSHHFEDTEPPILYTDA